MAGTKNLGAILRNSPSVRREFEGKTGFEGACPPQGVLDRIAEEKFTGKYNTKRANLCPDCKTFRSVSGTCFC